MGNIQNMKFGLMGEKLGHSWSKEIHRMMQDYSYDLIELSDAEFSPFLADNDYDGFNITIPYKKKIASYCGQLSSVAKRTGSINTVIHDENGGLAGYNTDYFGFKYLCSFSGITIKDKKVMILGDGGTGSTIKLAVSDMKAGRITVISRKEPYTYDDVSSFSDTQVVINTTPVGMHPDNYNKLIDINKLPDCEAVIDVIYNPMRTEVIEDAMEKGIKYVNGFPMLIAQAKYASQIFLRNEDALAENFSTNNDEEIAGIFKDLTSFLANIVLIGMPGSGKTAIGKAISRINGRKYVDIDAEIERAEGMTVAEIFDRYGEAYFREKETMMTREICKGSNRIITPGGGSVLDSENIRAMKQNGILIWVKRELSELDMGGRPLSKDIDALKKIYTERKEIYNKSCDIEIENTGSVDDAATAVMDQIKKFINKNGGFR